MDRLRVLRGQSGMRERWSGALSSDVYWKEELVRGQWDTTLQLYIAPPLPMCSYVLLTEFSVPSGLFVADGPAENPQRVDVVDSIHGLDHSWQIRSHV
jgi:hypothetical protein